MKSPAATLLFLQGASAFPQLAQLLARQTTGQTGCTTSAACNKAYAVSDQQINYNSNAPTAAQQVSAARDNCGFIDVCTVFDAEEQYVSTTGDYAYAAPTAGQIRGPCPGLNAAANHGYLPRSGVATITQTVTGLGALYGMGADLAAFLAAYAVALDGDLVEGTWSIGGPQPGIPLLDNGQGISWSHNKYEGDSSIGRCDAYLNGGDAHSLSITRFNYAFAEGMADDSYTFDVFSRAFTKNAIRSEATNPYYFAPLFSTTLVSPAAYNFVIAFMSNHSAEQPGGYLNGDIFKQFFAVSGEYPNFVWNKGQERIPNNWYRRPSINPYGAVTGVFGDLLPEFAAYPQSFRLGGNTNGVNSFVGIDLANLTGGVYDSSNLLQGNNLACFLYQSFQQGLPDALTANPLTNDLVNFLAPYLNKAFGGLSCPAMSALNDNNVPPYPGHSYSATPPANDPESC